ncbi:MAG: hypothetical protein KIS80_07180 [Anaerolineales bacterium]|nr:hypothetical protein [Anaerolineales bacterium]
MTRFPILCSLLALLAVLLSACGAGQPTTPTPEVSVPPTALPTQAAAQPLLLLIAPPDADAGLLAVAAEIAAARAAETGMRFEQRQMLDAAQIPAELDTLVLLAPDPGTAALAPAAPQARLITVGFSPVEPVANLTALSLGGGGGNSAAFLAGYLAAVTATDWRVGVLYSPSSQALAQSFAAGAEYFCGLCRPAGPPDVDLPMLQPADPGNWQAAADQLLFGGVRVVYLPPELENSGAAQYLVGYGVLIIGNGAPPPDLATNWIASVGADATAALRQQLPAALAGQPLPETASVLGFSHVNPQWLSQGRLEHIAFIITELEQGLITLD